MSDVTMLKRLCVSDFGCVISLWHCCLNFFADFTQSQAKITIVCGQHTKHDTAEPFHIIQMGPIFDVTMLKRLCVPDFGHVISL
jgi:hypothetical protein